MYFSNTTAISVQRYDIEVDIELYTGSYRTRETRMYVCINDDSPETYISSQQYSSI